MKIDYDVSNDFFKKYNKAYGINSFKGILKKNPNIKIRSYLNLITTFLCSIFIIMYILYLIFNYWIVSNLSIYLLGICFLIVIIYFINIFIFICNYSYYEKQLLSGVLELKKFGISNKNSNCFEMIVPYEKIDLIVITDDLIVFLTHNVRVMFIDNNVDIFLFIKEINRYSDVQIINKSSSK